MDGSDSSQEVLFYEKPADYRDVHKAVNRHTTAQNKKKIKQREKRAKEKTNGRIKRRVFNQDAVRFEVLNKQKQWKALSLGGAMLLSPAGLSAISR